MSPQTPGQLRAGGDSLPTPDDLASLLRVMNDAATRLEVSHQQLQDQVLRLTRELGEANVQLERARRLAALGEMAAGIAHEVRNPLGCISLYASMLDQDLRSDRPEQASVARKISAAAKNMESVISDVLAFARELRVRADRVEPGVLLEQAVEACAPKSVAAWRDVTVIRHQAEGLTLLADGSLLRQALINVVRNAFEAMAEEAGHGDHRLTLTAREQRVARAGGGTIRSIVLAVSDTGPGVPPDVVARMFNPFFTTRGAGTGLGLAIVHRIIDAHGGRVSVSNNTPGPGATVELIIPMDPAEGAVQPEEHRPRQAKGTAA
jgi:signal transduction histidine kinase